jgi:ligand-binding sensor domain-containing protein
MNSLIRARFFMSALLASSCAIASAAGLPFSPINLHHTAWTAKDGAPSNIIAIAQTPDSWMWLASQNGLYRFDGVRFEVFKTPKDETFGNDIWGMRVLSSVARRQVAQVRY